MPFPFEAARAARRNEAACRDAEDDAIAALEEVSRRIDVLAKRLGCPSHFDDAEDNRPRAA